MELLKAQFFDQFVLHVHAYETTRLNWLTILFRRVDYYIAKHKEVARALSEKGIHIEEMISIPKEKKLQSF